MATKKTEKRPPDDRHAVIVKLSQEQYARLTRFAEARGVQIGALLRVCALDAEREAMKEAS